MERKARDVGMAESFGVATPAVGSDDEIDEIGEALETGVRVPKRHRRAESRLRS